LRVAQNAADSGARPTSASPAHLEDQGVDPLLEVSVCEVREAEEQQAAASDLDRPEALIGLVQIRLGDESRLPEK
jgi:hypothetical protein